MIGWGEISGGRGGSLLGDFFWWGRGDFWLMGGLPSQHITQIQRNPVVTFW